MTSQNNTPRNYESSPHLKNELDEFTSYSYHFVMSVTDTTTAIGKMIDQSNTVISASGQNSYLSKILACKRPGEEIDLGDGDRSWLVLDTRRFSDYQLTSLDMEHVYGAGTSENPSVPSSTMNIQVVDTTGMSFFNMLMLLFREEIRSARLSCFFMISIVFVGHRPDGTTENTIISTCHIPCILLLMQFSVDHRGSVYDMVFMENDGGAATGSNMEAVNELGSITSINTEAIAADSSKLGDLVQALEDALNKASLDFYKKYRNSAMQQNGSAIDIPGKLVQYMFTIPEEWRGFICNQATKENNIPQQYVIEGAITEDQNSVAAEREKYVDKVQISEPNSSSVSLSFAPTTTITQAITHILVSSKEVLDLASAAKREAGEATLFKTAMNITSDKNSYVIHIDVIPYKYPKADSLTVNKVPATQPANSNMQPGAPSKVATGSEEPKNILVYDYIFTGKNSHILNLNIKYMPESVIAFDSGIETGRNRMSRVSSAGGNSPTNIQAAASPERQSSTYAPTLRRNDPILPGARSVNQRSNNAAVSTESAPAQESQENVQARNEYTVSTAYLHFISTMELFMTIRGNPSLLRKYSDRQTKGGQPPHPTVIDSTQLNAINTSVSTAEEIFANIVQQPLKSAKDQYYQKYVKPKINSVTTPVLEIGPDLMASPMFFKVNIKVPNIDYKTGNTYSGMTEDGERQPMYTDKFFFDGAYMALTVKTHFESGNFTHDVQLIPYILDGNSPLGN